MLQKTLNRDLDKGLHPLPSVGALVGGSAVAGPSSSPGKPLLLNDVLATAVVVMG